MSIDSLATLWQEAVEEYERQTGVNLSPPTASFVSAEDIYGFIEHRKSDFIAFRSDGQGLRSRVQPIASTVRTLCDLLGEAVAVAAVKVKKDFDAVEDAFGAMEHHLRIVKPNAGLHMHAALREASLKLLVQILAVLGVVTRLQQQGRLKAWVKNICHSESLDKALDELRRLATNQHQTVSAVTLFVSQRTLAMFTDIDAWDSEENIARKCLERILVTAQDTYDLLRRSAVVSQKQTMSNRKILEEMHSVFFSMHEEVLKERRSDELNKIFDWLQFPDCSAKINALLSHRTKGTGCWFLDSREFAYFKLGQGRMLWLEGSTGCGKSTLMASAINDLKAHGALSRTGALTIHHFFDATNSPRHRNLDGLTSSLLCQLAQRRDDLQRFLKGHYEYCMAGHSGLPPETSLENLKYMLKSHGDRIFIVLDALDEAADDRILGFLEDLCALTNVSLLISSRTEVSFRRDLERLADYRLLVKKNLVARDIAVHLDDVLAVRGALTKVKGRNVGLVRRTLMNGAGGNFRWTVLQIKELSAVAGLPVQLRGMLQNMPKTLNDTYDQALKSCPERWREDLRRLFAWLLFARGLLDKLEYSELLAFEHPAFEQMPVFDIESRPSSPDEIFTILNSTFVSYSGNYIRIAHASVRDYLLNPRTEFWIDASRAYYDMARTCMAYITAAGYKDSPEARLLGRYHLYYHASKFWSFYAEKALSWHYVGFATEVCAFVSGIPLDAPVLLELAFKGLKHVLGCIQSVKPELLYAFPELHRGFNASPVPPELI
ncbi:hypothetical protein HDZ31DRAFT_79113 [Schizophyllum fasciatum]